MIAFHDLTWAAGFLEGEGAFIISGSYARSRKTGLKGKRSLSFKIDASQVQRWPLDKLQAILGGTITRQGPHQPRQREFWNWRLVGINAVAAMMTLYPLLSPKRQATIAAMLGQWRAIPSHPRYRTRCRQGHELARLPFPSSSRNKTRGCPICRRTRQEAYQPTARARRQANRRAARAVAGQRDQQLSLLAGGVK